MGAGSWVHQPSYWGLVLSALNFTRYYAASEDGSGVLPACPPPCLPSCRPAFLPASLPATLLHCHPNILGYAKEKFLVKVCQVL